MMLKRLGLMGRLWNALFLAVHLWRACWWLSRLERLRYVVSQVWRYVSGQSGRRVAELSRSQGVKR